MLDVAHDSDYLSEHRLRKRQGSAAPDRIVRSPIELRGFPADQQHLPIVLEDVASTHHRNPHGPQVAGGDLPNLHRHRVPLRRVSLEIERL